MAKELIVHVGTFKTGSTSLQRFLDLNRTILLEKGIFYPKHLSEQNINENNGNAWPICENNADDLLVEEALSSLNSLFKEYNKILLSAEGFWSKANKKVFWDNIKEFGISVKIVVYLRRQDKYLDSMCNQLIKGGLISLKENTSAEILSLYLYADYYKELKEFEASLGKENIVVRVFEKEQLYDKNIYDDFLHCIGIKDTAEFEKLSEDLNVSLSNNYRAIRNVCNIAMENNFVEEDTNFYQIFLDLSQKQLKEKGVKEKSNLFSPQIKLEIIEAFAEGNSKIAKEFLRREDGILFYGSLPNINQPYKKQELDIESIIKLFTVLFIEQNRRVAENERKLMEQIELQDNIMLREIIQSQEQRIQQQELQLIELKTRQDAIYIPGQNKFAPMLQKIWAKLKRN